MILTETKLGEATDNTTYSIEVERINPGNKNYTKVITGTLETLAKEMFITPVPKRIEALIDKGNAKKRAHGDVIYTLIEK